MARVFDTSKERGRIRENAIKNKTESISKKVNYIPSIMCFNGSTSSDGPILEFLSPCNGFISNITFRGGDLVSADILVRIIRSDGSVFMNQFKVDQLPALEDGSLSVARNDMIDVSIVNQEEGIEDQDVSVSFIFNIKQ